MAAPAAIHAARGGRSGHVEAVGGACVTWVLWAGPGGLRTFRGVSLSCVALAAWGDAELDCGTPAGSGALSEERDSGVRPGREQDGLIHRSLSRLCCLISAGMVQGTGFFSLGQGPVGCFQGEIHRVRGHGHV